jgi:hypothetical protein
MVGQPMQALWTSTRSRRLAAGILAAIVWIGLLLQLGIVVHNAVAHGTPIANEIATHLAYFTILTNLLVAMVLTDAALKGRRRNGLSSPSVMTAVAVYISVVGLVYVTFLRHLWNPTGLQFVADVILHYVSPLSYLLYWGIFVKKGTLNWSDCLSWLGYPIVYMCYSLVRGRLSDFYPYPFINVTLHGYGGVLVNAAMFILLFIALGLVLSAIDRAIGRFQ